MKRIRLLFVVEVGESGEQEIIDSAKKAFTERGNVEAHGFLDPRKDRLVMHRKPVTLTADDYIDCLEEAVRDLSENALLGIGLCVTQSSVDLASTKAA